LHGHPVPHPVRRTIALAVIALAALALFTATSQRTDAKAKPTQASVTKGPEGLMFCKPPKNLPKQYGTLIWARKATASFPLRTPGTRSSFSTCLGPRTGPRPRSRDR
jgi:hypothetical protein